MLSTVYEVKPYRTMIPLRKRPIAATSNGSRAPYVFSTDNT